MSSSEQAHNPEQRLPRWEMNLSWADLVVAVLERKIIPPDVPDTLSSRTYYRDFRTASGDTLEVRGTQFQGDTGRIEESLWRLVIRPVAENDGAQQPTRTPYGLHIGRPVDESDPYEVKQLGSDIPLPPEAVEAVLSTVVTMVPISEAESIDDNIQRLRQEQEPQWPPETGNLTPPHN
jgi:hypothetical protein